MLSGRKSTQHYSQCCLWHYGNCSWLESRERAAAFHILERSQVTNLSSYNSPSCAISCSPVFAATFHGTLFSQAEWSLQLSSITWGEREYHMTWGSYSYSVQIWCSYSIPLTLGQESASLIASTTFASPLSLWLPKNTSETPPITLIRPPHISNYLPNSSALIAIFSPVVLVS